MNEQTIERLKEVEGLVSDAMTCLARLPDDEWNMVTDFVPRFNSNVYSLLLDAEALLKRHIEVVEGDIK